MRVTVKELMKLPIMQKNAKLISDNGSDHTVRYVTVVEAHNVHFPSFGEDVLVLTTLSAYHNSPAEISEFIQGLCDVKVSGICIKLGRFINEIPDFVTEIADRANVALIALSPTVYFREILSDTLSVITGNQQQMLNRINNLSKTMLNAIVQNQNIQQLLRIFCQEVSCYCCCMDPSGKRIAEASSLYEVFDTRRVREELETYIADSLYTRPYYRADNLFIFPCIVQNEFLAAFCVVVNELEEDLVCSLSQSIVSGINIKFLGENLKQQAEMELLSSTLDDILFSRGTDQKTITERLALVEFVPRKNTLIVLLSAASSQRYAHHPMQARNDIQLVFSGEFPSCVTFRHGSKYIVLLSYEQPMPPEKLKRILRNCYGMLRKNEEDVLDIGCSIPVTDLTTIPECYEMARNAISFGRIENASEHVYYYGDYYELGLILRGAGSCEGKLFADRVTLPIMAYDEQFGSELWHTLEISLSNIKLEQAADELHIHISTLRYRLQKIEALTGYNYFNTRDRLTLYLAVLLYRVTNGTDI